MSHNDPLAELHLTEDEAKQLDDILASGEAKCELKPEAVPVVPADELIKPKKPRKAKKKVETVDEVYEPLARLAHEAWMATSPGTAKIPPYNDLTPEEKQKRLAFAREMYKQAHESGRLLALLDPLKGEQ